MLPLEPSKMSELPVWLPPLTAGELAVNEPKTFASLVETAKKALPADVNAPKA